MIPDLSNVSASAVRSILLEEHAILEFFSHLLFKSYNFSRFLIIPRYC